MKVAVSPRIGFSTVQDLEQMQVQLTTLHLREVGHSEFWGAISVAQAAIKQCWFIANRDAESHPAERKRTRRIRSKP